MNRRRKKADVQPNEAKASGANVVRDNDHSLVNGALSLLQYEQNALTGAAEVQAAEFERMQRIVHAGQLVVRLVKSHVLDGILVVEGLDDDFADVPAYSVPDRKSGKDANRQRPNHISAERADIEADQETRGQQAAEKIQRMLNDCPVGDDESFAAEQQRFVTVVQTLWNSLSAEFPDDLPPRLAYERANAGPTAEIAASIAPAWVGKTDDLLKAAWCLSRIKLALIEIVTTPQMSLKVTQPPLRVKRTTPFTLREIREAYPLLDDRQYKALKARLQHARYMGMKVKEDVVRCRSKAAKNPTRTEYRYPAMEVEKLVQKLLHKN